MNRITVLCGLTEESKLVGGLGVEVLCGETAREGLPSLAVSNGNGLVSFGVCGGLDPKLRTGDLVLSTSVVTVGGVFTPDAAWTGRLADALRDSGLVVHQAPSYSDPHMWADEPSDRAKLLLATGATFMDTESASVAEFAAKSNTPFIVIRAVADNAESRIVVDPSEIRPDGSPNVIEGALDFFEDPTDTLAEAIDFKKALGTLHRVTAVSPPQFAL